MLWFAIDLHYMNKIISYLQVYSILYTKTFVLFLPFLIANTLVGVKGGGQTINNNEEDYMESQRSAHDFTRFTKDLEVQCYNTHVQRFLCPFHQKASRLSL